MQQNKPNIEEIIPPADVPLLPPQPGWYILGFLLLILLLLGILLFLRHKQRNAFRTTALKSIKELEQIAAFEIKLNRINEILKACALKTYPRKQVANLVGKDWINFLNNTSTKANFNQADMTLLSMNQYQKSDDLIVEDVEYSHLINQCEKWIKTHKLC